MINLIHSLCDRQMDVAKVPINFRDKNRTRIEYQLHILNIDGHLNARINSGDDPSASHINLVSFVPLFWS